VLARATAGQIRLDALTNVDKGYANRPITSHLLGWYTPRYASGWMSCWADTSFTTQFGRHCMP